MKATTVKIEGDLLAQLEQAKPENVSLSAYVREILIKDLRRQESAHAAVTYEEFLAAHPDEQSQLREWNEADLASAPKRRRK